MSRPVVVVGDVLLDVDVEGAATRLCPEAPVPVLDERARYARPGGAGLAAVLAAREGSEVVLVTALAPDSGGRELDRLLRLAGVQVVDLGLEGKTPTKERVRSDGHLLLRVDRGGGGSCGAPGEEARRALAEAAAVLVADYGHETTKQPELRAALAATAARVPVVWDPHPRGAAPVPGVRLVTPNRAEVLQPVLDVQGQDRSALAAQAEMLARRWDACAVAVTLGADGALLVVPGRSPFLAPASAVHGGDSCGAGDRFASAATALLAEGALLPDAVCAAVEAASVFVARGGAGSIRLGSSPPPPGPGGEAEEVAARVRAAGGTVVMTGGCFDLLHAGHVSTLERARALGDCLVVCLNSDRSVRRLKGSDRPLVAQEDRAAVLHALAAVDAVVVFDQDTPEAMLERFRPDIFAKGGDYALDELPEGRLLARWGGEVILLPYVEGRSTTRLLEEVLVRAG